MNRSDVVLNGTPLLSDDALINVGATLVVDELGFPKVAVPVVEETTIIISRLSIYSKQGLSKNDANLKFWTDSSANAARKNQSFRSNVEKRCEPGAA